MFSRGVSLRALCGTTSDVCFILAHHRDTCDLIDEFPPFCEKNQFLWLAMLCDVLWVLWE